MEHLPIMQNALGLNPSTAKTNIIHDLGYCSGSSTDYVCSGHLCRIGPLWGENNYLHIAELTASTMKRKGDGRMDKERRRGERSRGE